MDNSAIITLPGEESDLEFHVKICEQRYLQLIHKFDTVEHHLNEMDQTLEAIKSNIAAERKEDYKQHMAWAIAIIFLLLGWLAHYIIK